MTWLLGKKYKEAFLRTLKEKREREKGGGGVWKLQRCLTSTSSRSSHMSIVIFAKMGDKALVNNFCI